MSYINYNVFMFFLLVQKERKKQDFAKL